MFNITSFLDNRRSGSPEKIALIHPSKHISLTYRELCRQVTSLAAGLRGIGIRKGDRVVIFLDSSTEYLVSYFALWRIGAIVVPANIVYRQEELLYVLQDSQASALICGEQNAEILPEVIRKAALTHIIGVHCPYATIDWTELMRTEDDGLPEPGRHDDVCHIQYTSGTTGNPKGAMLTQGGWMAAFDAEREALDLTGNDIYLGIYPMGHVGISWGISTLREGGTYVIMERYHPEQYLTLAEEYKVTVLAGMPPVIHSLVSTPQGTEKRLRTVRRIISGGGPMHSPTWKAFHERFGIPIANAYGLSETIVLGTGTVIKPEHYPTADQYNSVGTPVGYAEVKIVDEDDPKKELEQGISGEIALRGPAVAVGYWNRPEESRKVFLPDGWFLTGDVGYIDPQGMLVITDRKKDMIIMSGWKIYPTEVENVLIMHPSIADIAIFGCLDEEKGEIPAAAVVLKEGVQGFSHEELVRYARQHLAGYKIPRRTFIVKSLPRMNGWKLMRKELKSTYCQDGAAR